IDRGAAVPADAASLGVVGADHAHRRRIVLGLGKNPWKILEALELEDETRPAKNTRRIRAVRTTDFANHMLPPGRRDDNACCGGHKTGRLWSARALEFTGDPAIVRLPWKPLRPVVLRPRLSAGLPLNSATTMRWSAFPVKPFFQPIRSRGSACSPASGVPQTTTTSPSLSRVSGLGSRPTMPSRRTALTEARDPRAFNSAMLRPTAQAWGGRMTLCNSSRKAWLESRGRASADGKYWRSML